MRCTPTLQEWNCWHNACSRLQISTCQPELTAGSTPCIQSTTSLSAGKVSLSSGQMVVDHQQHRWCPSAQLSLFVLAIMTTHSISARASSLPHLLWLHTLSTVTFSYLTGQGMPLGENLLLLPQPHSKLYILGRAASFVGKAGEHYYSTSSMVCTCKVHCRCSLGLCLSLAFNQ